MMGVKYNNTLSAAQIEERARKLGMEYPVDFKVINKKK
jgi:hypothetical protein